METLLTTSNITFIIAILAVLFSVYNYFRSPQVDADKRDALFAQQIKFQMESTEHRFKEIQESFGALLLQNANHIHTIDVKVDKVDGTVSAMGNEITRLATIIEERIPRKTV